MSDNFIEKTSTSWFSRIGNALKGIIVGIILIPLSLGVLFWNEGRAVKTAKSLKEGASVVRSVGAQSVDPANDGKLVHVSAPITVTEFPIDTLLGVSSSGMRLERKVEMFQWTESSKSKTRKKLGGGEETITEYSYTKAWQEGPSDSSAFKKPEGHQNPPLTTNSQSFSSPSGKIGAFDLSGEQLGKFGVSEPLALTDAQVVSFPAKLGTPLKVTVNANGAAVLGADALNPQIGDLRVSYGLVKPAQASLVASQVGKGFTSYKTSNGRTIFLTENGDIPAATMFKTALENNKILTWGLRALGLVLLFVGFKMIMSVVGVLGDVVPFFGSLLGFGTSLIAGLATVILGFVTISIAWIVYRPIVGFGILALGAVIAGGLWMARRKKAVIPSPKPA
jgi:Transmembrane protein 43